MADKKQSGFASSNTTILKKSKKQEDKAKKQEDKAKKQKHKTKKNEANVAKKSNKTRIKTKKPKSKKKEIEKSLGINIKSFFKQISTQPKSPNLSEKNTTLFVPYQPPNYAKIACIHRSPRVAETIIDENMQKENVHVEYLRAARSKKRKKRLTKPHNHCKLLQFHANYRPPFFGRLEVTRLAYPRNPWKKIDGIDYNVDSDQEWDEGVADSETLDREEEEDDYDDDDDDDNTKNKKLRPDGYINDGWIDEESNDILGLQPSIDPPLVIGIVYEGFDTQVDQLMQQELASFRAVRLIEETIGIEV